VCQDRRGLMVLVAPSGVDSVACLLLLQGPVPVLRGVAGVVGECLELCLGGGGADLVVSNAGLGVDCVLVLLCGAE